MPHRPQTGDAVAGVERICSVNEEESPFLLIIIFGEEGTGSVHCTLDPSFEAGVELRIATYILCLSAGYF